MNPQATDTDTTAYCRMCGRDDLDKSDLCAIHYRPDDNGTDREPFLTRYEGVCATWNHGGGCCNHNHA